MILLLITNSSIAATFEQLVKRIKDHPSVISHKLSSNSIKEKGRDESSWGDPVFKISAKNVPKDSLALDKSNMTGVEYSVSQKFPLSTKYGIILDSYNSYARSVEMEALDKQAILIKNLWEFLILKRKLQDEQKLLFENLVWNSKILKVSKRLYATGKVSQQALLEIQIRRSEIEAQLSNNKYELEGLKEELQYLFGNDLSQVSKVPWEVLDKNSGNQNDLREKSLNYKIKGSDLRVKAARLSYIPDLNISVGTTRRENLDSQGDFVGASISFPIPFSSKRGSQLNRAEYDHQKANKDLQHYKRSKLKQINLVRKDIEKIQQEILILNKTIKFAKNSREITSKSYGLGGSTYVELLQSELKLQKILKQKINLESLRDIKKIARKYLLGEPLNE